MMIFVQVAINLPGVQGIFDYHLPTELEGQVEPGCLITVPFGKQTVQGIVLGCSESSGVAETRPVLALLDDLPVLTPEQISLAVWLSETTLSPLSACLDLIVPSGLSQQADTLYSLHPAPPKNGHSLSPMQQRLLGALHERGPLRSRQLAASFKRQNWKPAAQALVRAGLLQARPFLSPPTVRPKLVNVVQLIIEPGEAAARREDLGRGKALERRQKLLDHLIKEPWPPVQASWLYAHTGANLSDLKKLAEMGLISLGESQVWRDPLEDVQADSGIWSEPPALTGQQQTAWESLESGLQAVSSGQPAKPFLLHGVTGSGKTELYLRAVAATLQAGRSAIVLVPEIALTPQTIRRFLARFPGKVGVIHSRLSAGERYDTWRRARSGDLQVIVGPRSALFTPLPELGLLILDECHDDSYYQDDTPPYYHAVETAIQYANLTRSLLVLGSATPGVSLTYRAQQQGWSRLHLLERVPASVPLPADTPSSAHASASIALPMPPVQIVDMREELKAGNRSIFSRELRDAVAQVLEAGQQAILFLNRRGSATYVFCRNCGYTLKCPRCDLALTYHLESSVPGELRCHTCNYIRRMPEKCPECGSQHIRHYGAGTEKVEHELLKIFPQARTLRWDAETTRRKGAHELLMQRFVKHQADILIGTQMLAKGLDLPLVTLVGVVLADVGLNFPDYRTDERAFQLLTQVAGRAGRSPLGGRVIFQTFQPGHAAIRAAAGHDYQAFYNWQLEERRRLNYPPFTRLARIETRSLKSDEAEQAVALLGEKLKHWIEREGLSASSIDGPTPAFFSRLNGYYRWQLLLRSPDPLSVLRHHNLENFRVEIDPPNIL